ncbi:hypothetical protein CON65_15205 [Bacillus pseudomycoides]|uniref:SH3 domain-containing protein n=1 Tax=Bacillus pseudomycoides TaxID=64104 RepID=A0AA91VAW2_9BACI|nr:MULTISPECIES: SH3 domain-containing protein [Bacillus]PEB51888.1 hypothetical protein COO03_14600 [Bacillus sp. AFS098217]PED81825.1 hypothetical protein CON65_15205 [Bacillus pseudomycoides]PEU15253.1 hypothetical protein CN525_17710 [Bacillus sp. AFS014408]PEU17856.1 hypothetical protein CN524_00975 [Bacillus sp. AFS019443]PFW63347.1 hypothetical protein COL20_09225 [Bacillus sp. AFS075034]
MKYIAIWPHVSNYRDPICLEKGDMVLIGKKYAGPENWDNWVYCHEERNNREGWVPEQLIQRNADGTGFILEGYTAKELNIEVGEILIGLHEWNGWIWCGNLEKEAEGWVPKQNLKQYR